MNFDFLFNAFGSVLAQLYELRHSYAFMIIGLTLIVMIIVTPLTLKATRSMLMMQQLQPELKRLQSKYKDDRQQLNEEMLKFYKENNINPVGGCLPLLIQTPIFLVLYRVLQGLTMRVPTMGSNIGHVVGQTLTGQSLTKPPDVLHLHPFAPKYLPLDSTLYNSLHGSITMNSIGLDLSRSASDVIGTSVIEALPYLILIALVAITGFVQQRQIQARNTGATVNPQQQAIMKIMPFFLPVLSFAMPAGLVIYFVVSNTYRVGQQWFISRNIYGKSELGAAGDDAGSKTGAKPSGPGGGEPTAYPASGGGLRGWLDRLSGQAPAEDEGGERPKAGAGKQPAKAAAKTAGSKTAVSTAKPAAKTTKSPGTGRTPAKGGRTTAKTTAKPAAKTGAGSTRNGETAGTRTTNASGSGGRTTSTRKGSGSTEPSPSTDRQPTLQPRARKNKKR